MGILFRIALLFFGVTAALPAAADPPRTSALLGDITFRVDPTQWQFETTRDGMVARCLADACGRLNFDLTVGPEPDDSSCDKESLRQEAERTFPFADRHPVNIYPVHRFALVMATSRKGDLGSPEAALACLTWQGKRYRFILLDAETSTDGFAGGHLIGLLAAAAAPPAATAEIKVGAMTIAYATDKWKPIVLAPGGSVLLGCQPPTCRDWGLHVVVNATSGETCGPSAEIVAHLEIAERPLCRNRTPQQRTACMVQDGVAYLIRTPGQIGCRSGPEIPKDAFDELLRGVRFVP